jgi:hypothetical protein
MNHYTILHFDLLNFYVISRNLSIKRKLSGPPLTAAKQKCKQSLQSEKNTGIMASHDCYYCSDVFKTIPQCYQHARLAHKEIIQKFWIPCPNCQKYFPTKKSANEHNKRSHPNQVSKFWTTCKACGKIVQTGPSFVEHLTTCKGKKRRTCKECKKIFSTKELMLAHARVMHAKQLEEEEMSKCWTTCKVCDQKVQTGRNFVQHVTTCNGNKLLKNSEVEMLKMVEEEEGFQVKKPFISSKDVRTAHSSANDQAGPDIYNANPPNCTANYEYKMQLINGIMAYHCQFCAEFYPDISNCYRHARLAHNEAVQQYWIPCPNCKKYFPTKKTLVAHTNANCSGCEHCNKVLNSRNELRNHVEQKHPEEMSKYWTKCLVCDGKFRVERSYTCHLKLCRQRNHPEEMSKVWTKCKACDQKIQTGRNFVQHMTICNGKKMLNNPEVEMFKSCQEMQGSEDLKPVNSSTTKTQCPYCAYASDNSESVYIHVRIQHTKEMEHLWPSCPHCKLKYPTVAHFKGHLCAAKLSPTQNDVDLDDLDVTLEWIIKI